MEKENYTLEDAKAEIERLKADLELSKQMTDYYRKRANRYMQVIAAITNITELAKEDY